MPSTERRGASAAWPWLLLLVTGVGGALRFYALGAESIWFDEAASWGQARRPFAAMLAATARDNYPPLHNILLHACILAFGDGEWALRLPSALLGTAAIPVLYWLGSITAGRRAGLLAAIFLALSPFHFRYSQEARMYTLMTFAALVFAGACLRMARHPSAPRAAAAAVAGLLLVYSHTFGVLYWGSIALAVGAFATEWRGLDRRSLVIIASSFAATALGFLPWAWVLTERTGVLTQQGFWIAYPTVDNVIAQLRPFLGGDFTATVLLAGVGLAGIAATRRTVFERGDRRSSAEATHPGWLWPFLTMALLPIAISLAISVWILPIFFPRYVIASLPAFYLASSVGYLQVSRIGIVQAGLGVLLTALLAYGFVREQPYRPQKQDLRGVAASLKADLRSGDCVLVAPWYNRVTVNYYLRRETCTLTPATDADLRDMKVGPGRVFGVFIGPDRSWLRDVERALGRRGLAPRRRQPFTQVLLVEFAR